MANRIDSLLCGLGDVMAVKRACDENLPGNTGHKQLFNDFSCHLIAGLDLEATRPAVLAMIAAALNREIIDSGYLWQVDGNGRLDRTYYSGMHERKLHASVISV